MNTYNLVISGSWWILILLFAIAFGLSYWTYNRTIPPISGKKRTLLISLRTLALVLLLFALFEPIYSISRAFIEEPKTAILLDNSVSAAAKDASYERGEVYRSSLDEADLDALSHSIYKFDNEVNSLEQLSFDSLNFSGQNTDISKAIRRIAGEAEDQNIKAVVMFTDGAFNSGNNPVFDAERLGKPFFIVGIGDTLEPNDLSVISILTNETAYVDNPIPVTINIKANGFDGKKAKLTIYDNNQKIDEQEILIEQGREKYSYSFEYLPKVEGIRKLTASVSVMENEITDKNNSLSEFVRVLKNKRNISIFAGAPSPDVSFIKQSLLLEKGVELKEYIQKQGAEFYKTPVQSELNASEMIILIGFPIQSTPKNVIEMIAKELERGKPLMFVASQNTDYNKLKDLQNYLPFVIVSSRPNEFLVLPDIKNAASSPLLRVTGSDDDAKLWNNLPPLFRTETFVRVKPESEIVSTMKINNAPLNDPLIVTRHFQNSKSVAFMGYGLYRWKLLGYASELSKGRSDATDLFSVLVNNSMRWLSVSEQSKPVKLKTSRKVYNQSESVELLGEIYDASYTPIDKANFTVKLSGGSEQRDITLSSLGNGRYYGTIAGLPKGDYSFAGAAELAGKRLGEDNGRFSIGEISIEYQNLKMNIALLKTIAERTGGKFYLPSEASKIKEDIEKHKSYNSRSSKQRSDVMIWNLPYLLGLAILLLAIEWLIRKRSGMI